MKDTSKYREAALRRWQEPGYRERMQKKWSAGQKKRFKNLEERQRVYELGIKKWQQENREQFVEQQKSLTARKDQKQHSATMKKKYRGDSKWAQDRKEAHSITATKVNVMKLGNNPYLDRFGRWYRFKSNWERQFAQWLDRENLTWLYEAHTYVLSSGARYTPDFFVQEWQTYVEIKGTDFFDRGCAATALKDGLDLLVLKGPVAWRTFLQTVQL